ncbi:hypothetical protein MBM09_09705 [Flaviramulus sp. BrNp1-15]|uniref:hypothetical protein n=1 Tax=Flaviramulus sp. BrNp1-15 TaxID=2916754 RepID=UPI001EE8B7C9|nr:hypothetical protein [Flaviramulus sp. BrNp1-15]ULC58192.1 hypothetical protein MBM09_09705 [Flaviramulus sp. BrNp1-15]
MKTSLLGLIFLGLTNLTFSQNQMAFNNTNTSDYLVVKKANTNAIISNQVSKRITTFQDVVSKYDITSNSIYTPNIPATYTVVFEEANNVITNHYGHDGEVISSYQKFEDIRLPNNLSADILKTYPGWSIIAVHCSIKYEKDKPTVVSYKVKINKGTKSKTIKITEHKDLD